jgi:diguanylate cyclase (GGDEF)-like protein
MALKLTEVFDEYPNPFFVIKPIISNGVSTDFTYIYVNQALCLFLGLSRNELVGHRYQECFPDGEDAWFELFVQAAKGRKHTYVNNVCTTISRILFAEVFPIEPDLCGCIIHDFKDATDNSYSRTYQELQHRANYDYLTGFYNRYYLKEFYNSIPNKNQIGITFLDINNLKTMNDTMGHAAGDDLILRISNMIRSIYKSSMVFRIGGDEFVILTIGVSRDAFEQLSQKSLRQFEGQKLAAIGYRFFDEIDDLQACIDQCDSIMYEHKRDMKNI